MKEGNGAVRFLESDQEVGAAIELGQEGLPEECVVVSAGRSEVRGLAGPPERGKRALDFLSFAAAREVTLKAITTIGSEEPQSQDW